MSPTDRSRRSTPSSTLTSCGTSTGSATWPLWYVAPAGLADARTVSRPVRDGSVGQPTDRNARYREEGTIMNLALWIVTGVLAAVLLVSTSKMFVPREKLASLGTAAEWVLDFSPGALRAIGT